MFRTLTRAADSLLWVLGAIVALVFVSFQNYPVTTSIVGALLIGFVALMVYGGRQQRQAMLEARLRDEHVPSMSPAEYEQFTAKQLERAGWKVKHCGRPGDQGCDVLAELRGFRLVVQVKLYRTRVGNDAVQQVIATRRHNNAQVMAVVAPTGFTRSAVELAASNGVHLLHHSALATLEGLARIP